VVPNHLLSSDPDDLPPGWADDAAARRALRPDDDLPSGNRPAGRVIVRGYLAGSGWKEYRQTGGICGIRLPVGLREGDRLPEPILTPSTKAEQGAHDENIGFGQMAELVGGEVAERIRDVALRLYEYGAYVTEGAGIILADTKLEFGTLAETGELILIDDPHRILIPGCLDHERWPQASYAIQFARDWLEAQPGTRRRPSELCA
jgi:phosphoribosylaminoimidazole-succinocarboxamide synthase